MLKLANTAEFSIHRLHRAGMEMDSKQLVVCVSVKAADSLGRSDCVKNSPAAILVSARAAARGVERSQHGLQETPP